MLLRKNESKRTKKSHWKGIKMTRRSTITGLSLAIRKTMTSFSSDNNMSEKKTPAEFKIKIANTLKERESVFQLAYQVYLAKGYIKENINQMLIQYYDSNPETVILIVQDQKGNLVGSLTLVFNECSRLPAEKIYGNEIATLRKNGERLVEISRLIIDDRYRNSKEVLLLLMNYLAIFSYHAKNYSALIIQVNPRHKNYYKALLNFDEIGDEKACPSVQNAPAILLHLPLSRYQSEVIRCTDQANLNKRERSLYPQFLRPEQEKLVACYLQNQVKPMTIEEKIYFGFTESGVGRAVCI
jgi:hypothetical protein